MIVEPAGGAPRLEIAGGSEVGRRYPANFDVLHLAADPPMAVVADGMGAGPGSAAAGRITVDTFVKLLSTSSDPGPPPGASGNAAVPVVGGIDAARLRAVVAEAQRRVRRAGERLGQLTGCTLTALVVPPAVTAPDDVADADADGAQAWLVQLGDSRAYRLRGGLLELLTVDHTMAWLGTLHGWYPAGSPEAGAARYHLTRYVGHPALPEPDVLSVTLRPGDVYCLCTDGVAEQVSYRRLAAVLGGGQPADAAVRTLLADTLTAGGHDNATVVVIRVGG